MQMTIELPLTLAEKISKLPNANHFVSQWLKIALLLKETDIRNLDKVVKDISEKVEPKNLTEEALLAKDYTAIENEHRLNKLDMEAKVQWDKSLALKAMKKLNGSGNGQLIIALLNERQRVTRLF